MFDHKIYESPFTTSLRNEFLYWLRNLAVFPAYALCIYLLIFRKLLPSSSKIIEILAITVILIIILALISTNSRWHQGFKDRVNLSVVSLVVITFFLVFFPDESLEVFALLFSIVLAWGMFQLPYPGRMKLVGLIFGLSLLTIIFLISQGLELPYLQVHQRLSTVVRLVPALLAYLVLSVIVLKSFSVARTLSPPLKAERYKGLYRGLTVLLGFVIVAVFLALHLLRERELIPIDSVHMFAGIALIMLLRASGVQLLTSWHWASVQSLLSPLRHDRIGRLVSPTLGPRNLVNRSVARSRYLISSNKVWIGLISAMFFGGVIIPVLLVLLQQMADVNVVQSLNTPTLFVIGVSSSLLFGTFYTIFWFVRNRQKHIVVPFKSLSEELQPIADLATHTFVEQLRHISLLLNLRQVENLNDYSNSLDSLFVTSGQGQEFTEQIQSLTDLVDDANVKFGSFLGKLVFTIISSLAQTKVTGMLRSRQDTGIEIWIQLTRRDGHVVAIDNLTIPSSVIDEIDEVALQDAAKTSAVKLIYKLGIASHLTSSWQSLRDFLNGLDASNRGDWWQAVASYHRAIQIEEIRRKDFGIGHYHLGAALIFQGEMESGLKHLQLADSYGPPLAETQYMLGLVLLYKYWSKLNLDTIAFETIVRHCKHALTLRSEFPEAHHLLGATYYQRGKLRERNATRCYQSPKEYLESMGRGEGGSTLVHRNQNYEDDYRRASQYFRYAIRQYKRALRQLRRDVNKIEGAVQLRNVHILRSYTMATHQLADAYRSLKLYPAADILYEDVTAAFPGNIRNLVDQSMNYCLAQNWQIADEFLRRNVLSRPDVRWNADANFYMAWALTGGLAEKRRYAWLEPFLQTFFLPSKGTSNVKLDKEILGEAFAYFDYALSQRPRYFSRWFQTNWQLAFHEASITYGDELGNESNGNDYDLWNENLAITNEKYIRHLQWWLAWRMYAHGYTRENEKEDYGIAKDFAFSPHDLAGHLDEGYRSFAEVAAELHKLREGVVSLLRKVDRQNRVGGLRNAWRRLELAQRLFSQWKIAQEHYKELQVEPNNDPIKFVERWCVDVYVEVALLTIRMLVESRAYEVANYIATETGKDLSWWIDERWIKHAWSGPGDTEETHPKKEYKFKYSPLVVRYQRATLYAWQAYTSLYEWEDFTTAARNRAKGKVEPTDLDSYFDEIQSYVADALRIHPKHPLAKFVQAQIYLKRELYKEAIDELLELLNIVAPFDPKRYTANWETGYKGKMAEEWSQEQAEFDIRSRLYYMERVSGQRQFEDILDRAQIHMALAKLFNEQEELELSIKHLLQAIAWSPYSDIDAINFLDLAKQLNRTNRFGEALNAIQEVKALYDKISLFNFSKAKRLEPYILECIINSRLSNYHTSLEAGRDIAHTLFIHGNQQFSQITDSVRYRLEDTQDKEISQFNRLFREILTEVRSTFENQDAEAASHSAERDEANEILPPVSEALAKLIDVAQYGLHYQYIEEVLNYWLRQDISNQDEFAPEWVIKSQIVNYLARESIQFITHKCELANNLAFNRAELKIELMQTKELVQGAVEIMHSVVKLIPTNHHLLQQFRRNLAQYYDTLGWICYRTEDWQGANKACTAALEWAQSSAIIHYHLSRVHIRQLENLWQNLSDAEKKDVPGDKAAEISQHLRGAVSYWHNAQRLDQGKRLYSRLSWLRQRIGKYQNNWDRAQVLFITE